MFTMKYARAVTDFTARSDSMKRKLAVSFSVIMTLTACAGGYSEQEESLSEASEQTEAVSEASPEDETFSRSTEQTESETAAVSFSESEKYGYKTLYRQKLTEIAESVGEYKSTFDLFDIP